MDRTIAALMKIGMGEAYHGEPLPGEKPRQIARDALGEVLAIRAIVGSHREG
jgi:hypothetical protein